MPSDMLQPLIQSNLLNEFDYHFGRWLGDLNGRWCPELELGAALLSHVVGSGDICLDLKTWAGKTLADYPSGVEPIACPGLSRWIDSLESSRVVGRPGDYRPLILDDGGRLYLHKYWHYESLLAEAVQRRVGKPVPESEIDPRRLQASLSRIFPADDADRDPWQKVAALATVIGRLTILTGGPGTGKTHTVARTLALLIDQHPARRWRIFLTAPTGKAAAKLTDSIQAAKRTLDCSQAVKGQIPDVAVTVHRLLRPVAGTASFYHHAENRLALDVLVVDEASMVDLSLMAKLTAALPEEARLLLIGDPDQLASVEAGSVLGDMCDRGRVHRYSRSFSRRINAVEDNLLPAGWCGDAETGGLQDCIVRLSRSHRFAAAGPIGDLSRAINGGNDREVRELLQNPENRSVQWFEFDSAGALFGRLQSHVMHGYAAYTRCRNADEALTAFGRIQVLSPLNRGPIGVASLNRFVEHCLFKAGLIRMVPGWNSRWYHHRPVMITANDYRLGLFNGDIGVTRMDEKAGVMAFSVVFPVAGGLTQTVPVHRLPRHETVYAMTVHKSQGSEFEVVHLILPSADSPVLTRELLYTAVTRAQKRICIWGSAEVLTAVVRKRIDRTSGLQAALWL